MNYFAHGRSSLDRPWVLAGTALPDWLRIADRRARLREEHLVAWTDPRGAQMATGVRCHLAEDRVFHQAPTFVALCRRITDDLRGLDPLPRFRSSVVAHVLVEMLLDAALDAAEPGAFGRYYEALEGIEVAGLVEPVERALGPEVATRLGEAFERFRRSRFLPSYRTDQGMIGSLAGVMRRVPLGPLPDRFPERLPDYRRWVALDAVQLMAEVRP